MYQKTYGYHHSEEGIKKEWITTKIDIKTANKKRKEAIEILKKIEKRSALLIKNIVDQKYKEYTDLLKQVK